MMHLGQVAVAAAICLLACGNCRAEGPTDSFSSCRQALAVMIGPKTTAAGIENIRDLKRLQSLCLRVPSELDDLRPRLFEIVGELSALEDLEIVGTIADADLMQLAAVKTLRRLILTHSRGYSDGALAAIVRALPNLQEVQRWYSR